MPLLGDRQHATRRHAAEFIFRHVIQQRTQQDIGHRFRDRHHVQQTLIRDHVGERGPALEGAEHRALGGVIHGVLFHFGTVRGIPGIVLIDIAIEHPGEDLLIGREQPALQRAGVGVRPEAFRGGSRWTAANAVRVDHAHVRIEPLFAVALKGP
ncbi:hypothetical protein D3C76_1402180 [compost metagenome]